MKKPAEIAYAKGPCSRAAAELDRATFCTPEEQRLGLMPEAIRNPSLEYMTLKLGEEMEIATNMLVDAKSVLNATIADTREQYSQLIDAANGVNDSLVAHIQALRSSRMACTSEVQQSLTALKDVRKFFLESDYELEMNRLERFVTVCKELKALKDDGTLDVIADTSLRLMKS